MLKHRDPALLFLLAASLCPGGVQAAGTTSAAFLTTVVSAGPAALAAGTAENGGSESLAWNPAGILGQAYPSAAFTHFSSLADTAYEQLEGLWPLGSWGGGLAGRIFYVSTYDLPEVTPQGQEVGSMDNHDLLIHLAYARPLDLGLTVGAAVKLFESVLADFSSRGAAVDLGLRWQTPWPPLSVGAAIQNWGAMTAFDVQADSLPLLVCAGAAVKVPTLPGHWLDLRADASQPLAGDETLTAAVGMEYILGGSIFLRGGYQFTRELGALTLGGGLRFGDLSLDYAYQPFAGLGANHCFTLSYAFRHW